MSPETSVAASIDIDPFVSFPVVRLKNHSDLGEIYFFTCQANEIYKHLEAPVQRLTEKTKIRQILEDGWERHLTPFEITSDIKISLPPLLISGRARWVIQDERVEIFGRGTLIDGARRLEHLLQTSPNEHVTIQLITKLDEKEEPEIRKKYFSSIYPSGRVEHIERFGTPTDRLVVTDNTLIIKVLSDPFVTSTSRNYVPVVLIEVEGDPIPKYLIVAAYSLFSPLEKIRAKNTSLKGCRLSIAKSGPERTAPYEVSFLSKVAAI
jgi:hypothetical protein